MNSFVAEVRKLPPITRFVCASLVTITGSVITNLASGYKFLYSQHLVFNKWQLWRLYTSFFLGSGGINFIFEIAMLYRYTNELESGPYSNKSGDLAWQLFWSCISIMTMSVPIQSNSFFRPLLHCIGYLSIALGPVGAQSSIFGLMTLPAKYMPYVMLGFELLSGGPRAVTVCLPGTVTGHLWWWLVWGSATGGHGGVLGDYSRAPTWIENYFRDVAPPPGSGPGAGQGANQGSGVHVFAPRRFANEGGSTHGAPSTRTRWGSSGRRLGSS